MIGRVNCVGVGVLDLVYRVADLPHGEGKIFGDDLQEIGGGMAANAAVTVARLGGRAGWFGRLGTDELGDRILTGIAAEHVAVGSVLRVPGVHSSHSVVLVDDAGRRLIVLYRAASLPTDPGWLPLEELLDCDVILADIRWAAAAAHVFAAARAKHLPTVLDADTADTSGDDSAIVAATHVIFSRDGLRQASDTTGVEEGLRRVAERTDAVVAVTLGDEGVAWRQAGALHRMAAHRVAVRDTLGAGDVFHGAFALALAEGGELADAFRFANAASAIKCAGLRGRDGIPRRFEVEQFLAAASQAARGTSNG
jgi:sulfofructose kinase